MRGHHNRKRSIKLTQLEFDAVISAVEFEHRAYLALGDDAAAEKRLILLAVLRAEWGDLLSSDVHEADRGSKAFRESVG
jgi:hypothetical protein